LVNRTTPARSNMPDSPFLQELAIYGPQSGSASQVSPAEARAYCRRLAHAHYENFTVASWLLPAPLRQHVCNLYAYCRWADDLADEPGETDECLQLLDWWEASLKRCYRGEAEHPVFIALIETIREFAIPIEPFQSLLVAFRQDQHKSRYATFDELAEYCRHSANPVGQLVLYLGRCHEPAAVKLSDSICTGLQLANHCQDVARDFARGRIYLPQDEMRELALAEDALRDASASAEFRELMRFQVERAERYLNAGWQLVARMPRKLRMSIELFLRGGLAICNAIRRHNYDVLARRPTVGKGRKLGIFARAWWNSRFARGQAGAGE
jgi:squalene synthase HpnC